jgi:DNA-binding LacI/PurR family transcriptional regulator
VSNARRERVTISDIAAQLGISKASVSYALNGRPGVSAETRARVLQLADELGFSASSAAVALSASRTGTIGIVIARDPAVITAEAFYMRTLFGVEQYLNEADGQLLLRLTGEEGEDLDVYRQWTRQGRVDGFLLYDEHDHDVRIPLLTSLGMPAVMVTSVAVDDGIGRLVTPEAQTVQVMLDHLSALGHREIVHLSGPLVYAHERVRTQTMVTEGALRGVHVRHVEASYEFASGFEATAALMALGPGLAPTAIVAGNDIMATAAIAAATDVGLRVPTDLSVIAWDDSVLCQVARPQLTAMDHGLMQKARLATDLLFDLISGGTQMHRSSPVGTLVVRGTTGPPAR